jgi:hypothetical protein
MLKGDKKKEYQRDYMRLKRSNKSPIIDGSNSERSNTYPAILHALVDPGKRAKLEKIYQSLKDFKVADKVYYGCGKGSVPFDVVGDLLEATR